MGRFTEDMGRLRDEIASDRTNRHTLIAETREEISASALAFMTDLKDSVETLQSRFRADFAEMAQSNRADRNAFITQLGTDVANLRVEAAAQRDAGRRAFIESAAEARAERASQGAAMREDVAQLQDGFRRARGEMATEVRAAGQAFVSDIVDAVTGLRRETIQLVDDLGRERASAREAWRSGMPKAPPPVPMARPKVQAKPMAKAAQQPGDPIESMAKPQDKPAKPEPKTARARDEGSTTD
ncbi:MULTISPECIES: hypothetical protein [unclassified Thiocapsa]|uniref:hypothetical protein n=1 Tax=unclassified Thiocapsa TaxID=2641286 RepID=UPI0035B4E633